MTDLIAELAEVRSKREAWAASPAEEAWNELALLAVNFTAHHAEIEAMARDAARYRWLRDTQTTFGVSAQHDDVGKPVFYVRLHGYGVGGKDVDAAIDAMHNSAREDGK